jgi:hypothetical protein
VAAGGQLTSLAAWLDRHAAQAPPVLGERARAYVTAVPAGCSGATVLAAAATAALDDVSRQPQGRAAALDLLAADALITLALLSQAEEDPARLHAFATGVLHAELARR